MSPVPLCRKLELSELCNRSPGRVSRHHHSPLWMVWTVGLPAAPLQTLFDTRLLPSWAWPFCGSRITLVPARWLIKEREGIGRPVKDVSSRRRLHMQPCSKRKSGWSLEQPSCLSAERALGTAAEMRLSKRYGNLAQLIAGKGAQGWVLGML